MVTHTLSVRGEQRCDAASEIVAMSGERSSVVTLNLGMGARVGGPSVEARMRSCERPLYWCRCDSDSGLAALQTRISNPNSRCKQHKTARRLQRDRSLVCLKCRNGEDGAK